MIHSNSTCRNQYEEPKKYPPLTKYISKLLALYLQTDVKTAEVPATGVWINMWPVESEK